MYLCVSTDEQDLARQEAIINGAQAAGYYVAAVYRKGFRRARRPPELLCVVRDL